jgi:hypothetical protein
MRSGARYEDVRLAMENAKKTLPWLEISGSTQLPRLAYCADERYFVPTEGISRGLVNCQTARMTMVIRRIEMRIFLLGPMTVETGSRVAIHQHVT